VGVSYLVVCSSFGTIFFAYAITKEGYSACRLHYESVNVNLKYRIPFIFSKLNNKGNKI
jgi:hypothetical protein